MIRHTACSLTALLVVSGVAPAQSAGKRLEFEVASVKPSVEDGRSGSLYFKNLAGDLNAEKQTLRALIAFAYNIQERQLQGGPGWIGTERFDIDARAPRTARPEEMPNPNSMTDQQREARDEIWRERLRSLLEDRFGLAVHHEMKDEPVFELSVAGSGPKLTPVTTIGSRVGTSSGTGRSQGFAIPIASLAKALSGIVGCPVLDKTGLPGKFDYVLEWTPDPAGAGPENIQTPQAADNSNPSLFTALREQLGLRMKSAKAPVDTIVIDRIRMLSVN